MSPFNEYRKSYITACFVTAVIYAFVVGAKQPLIVNITDGIIYGSMLIAAGLLLFNIFHFAIPVNYTPKYRIIFISALTVITSFIVTGIETLAVFLCFPSSFDSFVPTLPARIFITCLLFIITYFFYHENTRISGNIPEKTPMDSSKTDTLEKNEMPGASVIIDRITVRSGNKIKIIPVDSIIYIKADGDYISIVTADGKWLKEQTMNYTEDRLPAQSFVRVHRSYIVNIHYISRIERYGEKQLIVLHNNEKIKISAARYQLLRQILDI